MTEPTRLPRLYNEDEVGKLLKRATELQRQEGPATVPGGGMSLAELEDIAGEVGIDVHYLRRAAAEMSAPSPEPEGWERITGEQLTLVREAVIPGEMPIDGFERVVSAIQIHTREHGQPSLLGRTLTWQAETAGKTRTIQVTVSVRQGETHVRAEERLHQMASGLFAGLTAGAGLGVGLGAGLPLAMTVFGSALLSFAFPVASVGLSYMAAREIYRVYVGGRRKALARILDAVVEQATQAIAEEALADQEGPGELPRG